MCERWTLLLVKLQREIFCHQPLYYNGFYICIWHELYETEIMSLYINIIKFKDFY